MSIEGAPSISVVVSTRNRPADILRCLESLCHVQYPVWDIVLVDQSDDTSSEEVSQAIIPFLPGLRYIHLNEVGVSRGLNAGIAATGGELVAFLDDDCTVPENWLMSVADVFARHPAAGLVFGNVAAAEHDENIFFIPVFHISTERVYSRLWHLSRSESPMGASMYARRETLVRVGPFDQHLGTGGRPFGAADDLDYAYRVLACRGRIAMTPLVTVRHFGTRRYDDGSASRLVRRALYARAVCEMKLLRCGRLELLPVIATVLIRFLCRVRLLNLITRHGPSNLGSLIMYIAGLAGSFQCAVERSTRLYRSRRAFSWNRTIQERDDARYGGSDGRTGR